VGGNFSGAGCLRATRLVAAGAVIALRVMGVLIPGVCRLAECFWGAIAQPGLKFSFHGKVLAAGALEESHHVLRDSKCRVDAGRTYEWGDLPVQVG